MGPRTTVNSRCQPWILNLNGPKNQLGIFHINMAPNRREKEMRGVKRVLIILEISSFSFKIIHGFKYRIEPNSRAWLDLNQTDEDIKARGGIFQTYQKRFGPLF